MENLTWTEFESRNASRTILEVNDFPEKKTSLSIDN
jgi:hypothetical protein